MFVLLVLCCVVVQLFASEDLVGDDVERLGCHKKKYTYRVTQTDSKVRNQILINCFGRNVLTELNFLKKGRTCWDVVSVKSCMGWCDSNEISDYKFPFKRSFHPVCTFSGRIPSVATLRYCDDDVAPITRQYHYMEATSCKCQACSSTDTSCEAPKEIHHTGSKILDLFGGVAGVTEEVDY